MMEPRFGYREGQRGTTREDIVANEDLEGLKIIFDYSLWCRVSMI